MPKLRTPYNKYAKLQVLINGYMNAQGLNNTSLAAKMGCCHQTVANWRKDPSVIRLSELAKLCRILGIPAEELRAAVPVQ